MMRNLISIRWGNGWKCSLFNAVRKQRCQVLWKQRWSCGPVEATLSGPADADRLRGDEHRVAFVRIKKPCSVVAEQGFDCIS